MEDEFLMLGDRQLESAGGAQVHSSSQAVELGRPAGHIRGEAGLRDDGDAIGITAVGRASGKVRVNEPSHSPQAAVKRVEHHRKNLGRICLNTLASSGLPVKNG